ncbi:ATP-dependent RNA helicase DED1-like protein [Elsinoe fawcettii]|nr:ATP-dependent RNA helicase DED1-like protein [Elsinoe fawcettii]
MSSTKETLEKNTQISGGKPNWARRSKINYDSLANQQDTVPQNTIIEDIAEADPALEAQLFEGRGSGAGESLAALNLKTWLKCPERIIPIRSFDEAALHPIVLDNIKKCGYDVCTAVQGYSIPAVLRGNDVVAVSQTGSGKTAAYLAPIISELMGKVGHLGGPRVDTRAQNYDPDVDKVRAEPLVLIICPTRELAHQIHDESRRLAYRSKLRTVCSYGGTPVKYNLQQLGKGCDILIGTPGRLMDIIEREGVVSLQRVRFTVIDEADEMLMDADFGAALEKIINGCDANENADHRYMMFSATFPKEARALARQYLQEDFVELKVGRAGSAHKNVDQEIIYIDRDAKPDAILDYLMSMEPSRTIIFCNTNSGVERLDDILFNKELPTVFLHGGRDQLSREDAVRSFNLGKTPILITSSVVARGIDFKDVHTIINYDLPSTTYGGIQEYVHRIGRTGRIGHRGKAVSFYNENDEGIAQDLVNNLMENEQEVPDFLSHLKPEDGVIQFADDTDEESDGESAGAGSQGEDDAAAGSTWGSGVVQTEEEPFADTWGTTATTTAEPVTAW